MARLMFDSKIERNNNNKGKGSCCSIAVPDNKCKDMIVMTNVKKQPAVVAAEVNNGWSKTSTTGGTRKGGSLPVANGFKVRQQPPSAEEKVYRAKKVLVSATTNNASTVARLTSKFNATSCGDTDKPKVRSAPSNKCQNSCGPRVSLQKESSAVAPKAAQRSIKSTAACNNSSVLEAIKFFEQDSHLAAGAKLSDRVGGKIASLRESIVRGEQRPKADSCDGKQLQRKIAAEKPKVENGKPSVQPKPVVLLQKVGKENRLEVPATPSSLPEVSEDGDGGQLPAAIVVVKQFENSLYHAPKLLLRKDVKKENLGSDYQVIMTRSKRLSIAKDFTLESVLNADMNGRREEPMENGKCDAANTDCAKSKAENPRTDSSTIEENAATAKRDKMANSSFLHKYLEQCLEGDQVKKVDHAEAKLPDVPPRNNDSVVTLATVTTKNLSALHDTLLKKLKTEAAKDASCHPEEVIYEDLPSPKAEDHENQYMAITEDDSNAACNLYDDVIYAQLHHNGDVENYETIFSGPEVYVCPPNGTPVKAELPVVAVPPIAIVRPISRSESDSSFEQANSLYDVMKPTSDFSSATASTFSSSNDCININIESPYVFVSRSKSSSSDMGEDEVTTDDWETDENDHEEIIVFEPNRKRKLKKRKFKFLLRQKDYVEQSSVIEEHPDVTDEFFDDFDDSSSEGEPTEMNGHADAVNHLNKPHSTANNHSQNIYGLVEKARKTVRKSWSSLNQIRKLSVGNISNNFPLKIPETNNHRSKSVSSKSVSVEEISVKNGHSVGSGGSIRWTTLKSKFRPRYSTINSSTSIFYLNPEDLCFDKSSDTVNRKQNNVNNRRRRMTCIELRPTRPTSPPPPPPVDRPKSTDNQSVSNSNIYSDRSNSSYESRNSMSGAEASFDLNSSRSSDLHLRFADEPLYQFYAESVVKLTTDASSMDCLTDSDGYEEIASTTSRPSAMELIVPSPNGHGQHRTLWCEVDEVKNSGILETLSPSRQRLQEAIFEIITSEASYYKSLSVLDKTFASNPLLKDENSLTKNDWKILFGNVAAVRKCSEKLLAALETCWQDSILLTGLCNVIYKHASENFRIYVKYCSNQIYIDRTLKTLKEQNSRVMEIISQLEANPMCQSLTLHSFLMLPMQRITRMPLLLDAVLSRMDPLTDSDEYKTYQITLATLNKIVKECNETARKLERYEEMLLLSGQLEFSRKDVKMFSVASSSRWLIRSGPMVHINPQDIKLTFTRKLTKQATKFYFFLFNDILVVAKKKSEDTYVVFDYSARNMIQMSLLEDNCASAYKYLLMLTILENHEGKTVEMILSCDSDSTRQRWLEATSSHLTSDNPDEKLYEEWDCPQVSTIHAYTALQPDELSLQAGDVVKVLKKTTDGWYHGERIRDGSTGWFPGNYTVEIASQHMRAKNLRLRHRLLTLSGNYLQYQLQKKC